MIGDESTQPTENASSLSDIADLMGGDDEHEAALGVEDEGEEESEATEEVDTEEEEGDDESEESEKIRVTVKHDGKTVDLELTPEEHVEMLQKSFDYTAKTMAVAEERKAVEAERDSVRQVRQQHEHVLNEHVQRLQALAHFTEAQLGDPPPIQWAQEDAAYYLAQKELYESRRGQLHQAHEAISQLQQEQARQRQAWIMERAVSTERALRDTLPGWNDEALHTYAKYAEGFGLNPQTVSEAFVEKGFWEVLHKAKAYDELQARKATLKPRAELPKVSKPKASNQTPRGIVAKQAAEKAFHAKPSINTLANLLD